MSATEQQVILEHLLHKGGISKGMAQSLYGYSKDTFWNAIRDLRRQGYYIVAHKRLGESLQTVCVIESEEKRESERHKTLLTKSDNPRLWNCWHFMRGRCNNPNHTSYSDYGGRGIRVCEEWNNDFQPFAEWSLANGYSSELTIDRIDNNGNYEPGNCRWVDMKTQCRNRRNNRLISFNGQTRTLSEWSEILRIPISTLHRRLDEWGNVEKALTTPVRQRKDNCKGIWIEKRRAK